MKRHALGPGVNGAYSVGLVVTDFDADVRSDVAYVEANTRAVHVFRNNSGTSVSFTNEVDSGSGPYSLTSGSYSDIFMAAGDFDADGRPDLAVIGKVFLRRTFGGDVETEAQGTQRLGQTWLAP